MFLAKLYLCETTGKAYIAKYFDNKASLDELLLISYFKKMATG